MSYQSFPWQRGDSDSYQKLLALDIPDLKDKTFLDVGCNTGFFCGYAKFLGAARAVGIDRCGEFIALARMLFPECEFRQSDWNDLGDARYDVILNASAIHYAEDQKSFLDNLMGHLKNDGLLILELGVAPGSGDEFVEVDRSIDKRKFPTVKKLESLFAGCAVEYISQSVPQAGDPVPRHVYHLRRKLPVAILLMDDPHAGKTAIAKQIFRKDIRCISGDQLYSRIQAGSLEAPPDLEKALKSPKAMRNFEYATYEVCKSHLLPRLCEFIDQIAEKQDFILDMYMPLPMRPIVCHLMEESGYFVVDAQLQKAKSRPRIREAAPARACRDYMDHLVAEFVIDEADYLAANPDVAQALARKEIRSGQEHFLYFGKKEGRPRK